MCVGEERFISKYLGKTLSVSVGREEGGCFWFPSMLGEGTGYRGYAVAYSFSLSIALESQDLCLSSQ